MPFRHISNVQKYKIMKAKTCFLTSVLVSRCYIADLVRYVIEISMYHFFGTGEVYFICDNKDYKDSIFSWLLA